MQKMKEFDKTDKDSCPLASWPTGILHLIMYPTAMSSIRAFSTGVSAGQSGQRPDFYKQLVGNGDKPAVPMLLKVFDLLEAGRAPAELRAFIGGAKGTAVYKKAKYGSDVQGRRSDASLARLCWRRRSRNSAVTCCHTSSRSESRQASRRFHTSPDSGGTTMRMTMPRF